MGAIKINALRRGIYAEKKAQGVEGVTEAAASVTSDYSKINRRSANAIQHGISAFPDNDPLKEYSKRITPQEGCFDVSMHGNASGVGFGTNKVNMGSRTLADMIRKNPQYKKGEDVRLLCCNTGNRVGLADEEYCFAEELANDLGVTVYAPDDLLYINRNGEWHIGRSGSKKELKKFVPNERGRLK